MALLFIVVLAVGSAAFLWTCHAKQKRREAIVRFGLQFELEYSRQDPFGLLSEPFKLFRLGDGRGIENVLAGRFQGLPLKEADYWYYTESTESKGSRSRSYHHFSVVVAEVGADLPDVRIER